MIELVVDKRLDNKRIPFNFQLVYLEYKPGDTKIKRKIIKYNKRSGYCLDAKDKNKESISINDIGTLRHFPYNHYEIYSYIHKEQKAINEIKKKNNRI